MPATETPETGIPESEVPDSETPQGGPDGEGKKARPDSGTPRMGLQGLLTRDTDMAARPGFRNPSNKKSKAQKAGKKKR